MCLHKHIHDCASESTHWVCKLIFVHICVSVCVRCASASVCVCVSVAHCDRYSVIGGEAGTQRRGSSLFHCVLARSTQADSELPHTWPGSHAYGGGQGEGKQE